MKPSAWAGAVGLGLFGMSVVGVIVALAERAVSIWFYAAWFFGLFGLVLAVDLVISAVLNWKGFHVELEAKRQDNKRAAVRNATDEWNLKVAKRQADAASGLAGAREAEALERRWQVGAEILFRAIDKAGGASGRKLSGVVGSDTHPALMAFYTSPAGLCILRDAGGNVGHTWGFKDDGGVWCLDDVLALNRAGKLPHPDGEPPEINPLPPSAAQRNAPRKGATQKSTIIDGTAREVGQ